MSNNGTADRNSILEFEILEKECFNQEADRSKLIYATDLRTEICVPGDPAK